MNTDHNYMEEHPMNSIESEIHNSLIEHKYREAESLINKGFKSLRNQFNESCLGESMIHICPRASSCKCILYFNYLLTLSIDRDMERECIMEQYFGYKGKYLPFQSFYTWVMTEIKEQEYTNAEERIKSYITATNNIRNLSGTASILDGNKGAKDISSISSSICTPSISTNWILELEEWEYYTLLETLIFKITLPSKGFLGAKLLITQLPCPTQIKYDFLKELKLMHEGFGLKELIFAEDDIDIESEINNSTTANSSLSFGKNGDLHDFMGGSENRENRGNRGNRENILGSIFHKVYYYLGKEYRRRMFIYNKVLIGMFLLAFVGYLYHRRKEILLMLLNSSKFRRIMSLLFGLFE